VMAILLMGLTLNGEHEHHARKVSA